MILTCALIAIIDGDTLDAACPDRIRIRIANIDAPERGACPLAADRSAAALRLWTATGFTARPLYTDRYGRIVATLDAAGTDVGAALVDKGFARPWPHDTKGRALAPRPEGC